MEKLLYLVPYADVDRMGFVYYANYLVYFERLRNQIIRRAGTTYLEIENSGIYLPVIESGSEFLLPAHFEDTISITGRLAWVQGSRFQVDYEILREVEHNPSREEDDLLVRGFTIHNTINKEGNPRRVPKALAALVE